MRSITAALALAVLAVVVILYTAARVLLDAAARLDRYMDEAHWPPKSMR